jgi:hypothetical protein
MLAPRNPTVGSFARCCARAASGHATAAPPTNEMKSRRRMCPSGQTARAYHSCDASTPLCTTAKLIGGSPAWVIKSFLDPAAGTTAGFLVDHLVGTGEQRGGAPKFRAPWRSSD